MASIELSATFDVVDVMIVVFSLGKTFFYVATSHFRSLFYLALFIAYFSYTVNGCGCCFIVEHVN